MVWKKHEEAHTVVLIWQVTVTRTKARPHIVAWGNRERLERMEGGSPVTEISAGPDETGMMGDGLEEVSSAGFSANRPGEAGTTHARKGPKGACMRCGGRGHPTEECFRRREREREEQGRQ